MRIISKYKDFYDNLTAYGVDPTQVFVRHQEVIKDTIQFTTEEKQTLDYLRDLSILSKNRDDDFSVEFLYFCGKIYPIYFNKSRTFTDKQSSIVTKQSVIGLSQDFLNEVKLNDDIKLRTLFLGYRNSYIESKDRLSNFEKFTIYIEDLISKQVVLNVFKDLSLKHKLAYFLLNCDGGLYTHKFTFNIHSYPLLKDLGISSCLDGSFVFQQIEQYLFSFLSINQRPMIELSDEIKASKHGHDGKYSFKTPPSEE